MASTVYTPSAFAVSSSAEGFPFECSCGEQYSSIHAAYTCRKCRNYCVFGYCTHVVDLRTGEVVAGKEPTEAEWAEAKEEAEQRWAEERAELELQEQMWRQEGELYEAEMQRRRDEEEEARQEAEEDALWELQERLGR